MQDQLEGNVPPHVVTSGEVAIATINFEGTLLSVDQSLLRLFGYTEQELLGNSIRILFPPPYREQSKIYIQDNLQQPANHGVGFTLEGLQKDGTAFVMVATFTPLDGSDGLWLVFFQQVDQASAWGHLTCTTTGTILSANDLCQKIFQAPSLANQPLRLFFPVLPTTLDPNYFERPRHAVGQTTTGTKFPACIYVTPVKIAEKTSLLKIKLKKLCSNSQCIFTLAENGNIISANRLILQTFFGHKHSEVLGKHISSLARGRDGAENWRTVIGGTKRVLLIPKFDAPFEGQLTIQLFHDDDGFPLYAAAVRRICDLEQYSDAENTLENYQIVKTIGRGSYGRVVLAEHTQTRERFAIKVLEKDVLSPVQTQRALREVEILKTLSHPHIAKFWESFEVGSKLCLVLDLGSGGTLQDLVLKEKVLSEARAQRYMKQLISALEYCHGRQIIHRDIKLSNIILDESRANSKLIDFGLANFMRSGGLLRSTFCGTPAFASPEMVLSKKYSGPEIDVWSLGVVLYSMVVGSLPFSSMADLTSGTFGRLPEGVSPEFADLIKRIFVVETSKRITLAEELEHPWMKLQHSEIALVASPNLPPGSSISLSALVEENIGLTSSVPNIPITPITDPTPNTCCPTTSATINLDPLPLPIDQTLSTDLLSGHRLKRKLSVENVIG